MRKASDKTYISKRQLELYQRERAKLTQEAVPKEFAEDEEAKKNKSVPTTQLGNISEEENLSADEIDSDDLGDDIAQTRQQVQQQPQQQFMQPQNFMMQSSNTFGGPQQ